MTELVIGVLLGVVLISAGFYAGWRFRDEVGQTRGEPSVSVEARGGGNVLDDWPTGEDE